MKIKYLGTAAYEGVPSLFCNCDVCTKSRKNGGRNMRSRSQALVNDDLLIEFPPDTVWHYHTYNFDWNKIGDCIITHSHGDHLYPADIEMAAPGYVREHRPLNFYATKDAYDKICEFTNRPNMNGGATATLVEAGKSFKAANGRYTVLPLRANHEERLSPVIYSVSDGNKRLLYAHDTGVFYEDTWAGLKTQGYFDLISLDCTGCFGLGWDWINGHMSLKTNLGVIARMREEKLIDDKTIIVVNHFSHNGGQTYDEMVAEAEKHGIIVSYDGMEIEF